MFHLVDSGPFPRERDGPSGLHGPNSSAVHDAAAHNNYLGVHTIHNLHQLYHRPSLAQRHFLITHTPFHYLTTL